MSFLACCASNAFAASVNGYVEVIRGFKSTSSRDKRLMASEKQPGVYRTVPESIISIRYFSKQEASARGNVILAERPTFDVQLLGGEEEQRDSCQGLAQASLNACISVLAVMCVMNSFWARGKEGIQGLHVPPAFNKQTAICAQTSAPLASTVTSNPCLRS